MILRAHPSLSVGECHMTSLGRSWATAAAGELPRTARLQLQGVEPRDRPRANAAIRGAARDERCGEDDLGRVGLCRCAINREGTHRRMATEFAVAENER